MEAEFLAYVQCNIFCQHRLDLEGTGTEVLWLEYRTSIAFSITYNYG